MGEPSVAQNACQQMYSDVPLSRSDSIRVLELVSWDEVASNYVFQLRTIVLSHEPFRALSYTWTLPDVTPFEATPRAPASPEIECNGHVVKIGTNLFEALAEYEKLFKNKTIDSKINRLWVDALCINQSDLNERSAQVGIMDQIYEAATNVIVWLGQNDLASHVAFSVMDGFGAALLATDYLFERPRAIEFNDAAFFASIGKPQPSMQQWLLIGELFMRSWFRRMWTVQEVSNASGPDGTVLVLCGDEVSQWEDIFVFVSFLMTQGWFTVLNSARQLKGPQSYGLKSFSIMANAASESGWHDRHSTIGDASLIYRVFGPYDEASFAAARFAFLMHLGRQREASDSRDKVFAPLKMIKEYRDLSAESLDGFVVDYTMSEWEVLAMVTRFLIQKLQNLSVLGIREIKTQQADGIKMLPSWALDFTLEVALTPLLIAHDYGQASPWQDVSFFDFGGFSDSPNDHWRLLPVQGNLLDKVLKVSDPLVTVLQNFQLESIIYMAYEERTTVGDHWLWKLFKALNAGASEQFVRFEGSHRSYSQGELGVAWYALLLNQISCGIWAWHVGVHGQAVRTIGRWWHAHPAFGMICDEDISFPSREEFEEAFRQHALAMMDSSSRRRSAIDNAGEGDHFHDVATQTTPVVSVLQHVASGRLLVRTADNNFLGLAPLGTKAGDEIWWLHGSRVPMILRKVQESNGTSYTMIGEVYVTKFIDGSAIDKNWRDEVKTIFLE